MENGQDREDVENVEQTDQPTDQIATPEAMAVMYGDFMLQCLDIASGVLEKAELLPEEGLLVELQTQIAMVIFSRCTRETSGLETMVQMAMQYLALMVQDKQAENERSAELRSSVPFMPTFGGFLRVGECKHSGLRALYEQLDVVNPPLNLPAGVDREKAGGAEAAAEIIEAMTLRTGHEPESVPALLCPHCRALVPVDKVTSGELWEEPEESEEEEETE